jgi:hypothetical protein
MIKYTWIIDAPCPFNNKYGVFLSGDRNSICLCLKMTFITRTQCLYEPLVIVGLSFQMASPRSSIIFQEIDGDWDNKNKDLCRWVWEVGSFHQPIFNELFDGTFWSGQEGRIGDWGARVGVSCKHNKAHSKCATIPPGPFVAFERQLTPFFISLTDPRKSAAYVSPV